MNRRHSRAATQLGAEVIGIPVQQLGNTRNVPAVREDG
jgi:hypothetical protein